MPIQLRRVYEKPSADEGKRILVERLWPRGLKKEDAHIDEWLKELAPSNGLRIWYGHDPAKWSQFKQKYWKELATRHDMISRLAIECRDRKVTFVFASKEQEFNSAVALKEYIEKQL